MKSINFRRVFITAGLSALIITYFALWIRMINSPAERNGSDFISSYTGGRVAVVLGAANVYNLEYQQTVQSEIVGFPLAPGQVLMFNHPPYLVLVLAMLMDGNYTASLVRYTLVMVVIYAAALAAAYRLVRLAGWEPHPVWLLLAGMATFYPIYVSLLNTQDTALLVLGGILCLLGLQQKKDFFAGVGLALTTVRPHLALLLAIPFLFNRRRVFWGFILAAAILVGVGWLAVGITGLEAYARILLSTAGGVWFGINESAMVNLVGLLMRFFPGGGNILRWIGWGVYAAAIIMLCLVWARTRNVSVQLFGTAAALAVFVAPHLHYHDLALLLVPLLVVVLYLVQKHKLQPADGGLVLIGLSLVLILASMVPALKFNLPCIVELILITILLVLDKIPIPGTGRPPGEVISGMPG